MAYKKSNSKPKRKVKNNRKKRFSLSDRVEFYGKKIGNSNPLVSAFSMGYLDSAVGGSIDSSVLKTDAEKEAYHKGCEKGNAALYKSRHIKF